MNPFPFLLVRLRTGRIILAFRPGLGFPFLLVRLRTVDIFVFPSVGNTKFPFLLVRLRTVI